VSWWNKELDLGRSFKPLRKQSQKAQLQLSGGSPAHHLMHTNSFKTQACHCHPTCLLVSSSPEALQDLTLKFPRQDSSHLLLHGMPKALKP